jgi:predicted XRE-type DNA-binding protein
MAKRRRPALSREKREESSGNVFLDIGCSPQQAENLLLRAHLMAHLRKVVRDRNLTQAAAASMFRVTQPRISDLARGKIDLFSIDALIAMLTHAGMKVELRIDSKAA